MPDDKNFLFGDNFFLKFFFVIEPFDLNISAIYFIFLKNPFQIFIILDYRKYWVKFDPFKKLIESNAIQNRRNVLTIAIKYIKLK